jgi:hypothetical protein
VAASTAATIEELLDGRDQRPVLVHLPGGAHVRIAREFGAEVAGLDDRDLDAERGNLVPQRLAPGLKGELARAVSAKPADRDQSADARQVEHVTAPLRPHVRQHGTREFGGGEEVQLHLLAQLVGRERFHSTEGTPSGDIGQHVDPTEPGKRRGNGVFPLPRVGSPQRAATASSRSTRRAANTARSPRSSTQSARARPKPDEAPVINQTLFCSAISPLLCL